MPPSPTPSSASVFILIFLSLCLCVCVCVCVCVTGWLHPAHDNCGLFLWSREGRFICFPQHDCLAHMLDSCFPLGSFGTCHLMLCIGSFTFMSLF